METKELLKELTEKLERLQAFEDVSTGKRGKGKKKRIVSEKARAAIGAAQKKRWAKVRAEKGKG
jgi:hypothetical protein